MQSSGISNLKDSSGCGTQPSAVSVVTIFWNAERFLEEAIESVVAQTYRTWELLLVDDGSTDMSSEIALRWSQRYPDRVRYLEHPGHVNNGMSASRNLGVREARGEYVAFLDSDDVWLPNKLEEQVALFERYPEAGMVCGPSMYWHSWNGQSQDSAPDRVNHLGSLRDTLVPPPTLLPLALTGEVTTPSPSNILLRRSVIMKVGGFEEQFRGIYQMYEDQAFLAKVQLETGVYIASSCWDRYRKHSDSLVAQVKRLGKAHEARRYYLTWLAGYLQTQNLKNGQLGAAVQREIRKSRPPLRSRLQIAPRAAVRRVAQILIPTRLRRRILARWHQNEFVPPAGQVRFGDLGRLTPISRRWGKDRGGLPIDRFYIERFLQAHAGDIHGRVLEVQDASYTRRFGGERVTQSDVLHAVGGNHQATIVADLMSAPQIPSDTFDCIILTQVLLCIPDVRAAVRTVHRILRPGGVALVTLPGISQIARHDMERWGDYWRFTTLSSRMLFECVFAPEAVQVEAHGNVLAAVAFLHGLSSTELRPEELSHTDQDYQLLITIRAVKTAASPAESGPVQPGAR